jgi:amino acid adenylation domain-containing protein
MNKSHESRNSGTTMISEKSTITINDILEKSFNEQRLALALIYREQALTYGELDKKVRRLSRTLLQEGAGPEKLIAVGIERSAELIITILAIVRSGAAYVPLDAKLPAERVGSMLEDAKPHFVITSSTNKDLFVGVDRKTLLIEDLLLREDPPIEEFPQSSPLDLLYVLFTSGSTGRPKGVAMNHGPLINLLNWQVRTSVCGVGDRTLQFAPISFDVSFQEIFTTFAQGGMLLIIDDDDRLNSAQLLRTIISQGVNRLIVPFVALQYLADAVASAGKIPTSLKEVFTSGEQLRVTEVIKGLFKKLPSCRFCNQYGPTEGHVVSELELKGDPALWPALPSIGKAIDNVSLYILGQGMERVEKGEEGELYLGGSCVARGYLGSDATSSQRFMDDPFHIGGRLYKTGDRVVENANGEIEFRGRADGQVKIRGYRIELGEIEVAMEKHHAIDQAVATVREDRPGSQKLVCYYIEKSKVTATELRRHLGSILPDYMQPTVLMQVLSIPRTHSGKIDRGSLPIPESKRPQLDVPYVAPKTEIEISIASLWCELLGMDQVGVEDNFFDLGGNSLLSIQFISRLELLGPRLPIVKLYRYPTIRQCAAILEGRELPRVSTTKNKKQKILNNRGTDVAVIGISGRFPGANDVSQLWKNLIEKKNSISEWSIEEIDPSIPVELRSSPDYVKARGVIANADKFDHEFFGINSKLADLMDPQHRVFMEIAWAALEDAAYDPATYEGLIGVFAGTGNNSYFCKNVAHRKDLIEQVGEFAVMTANEKDYIATRVAFEFNLKGPALSIHTACSTSLVAIIQGVASLRDGSSDIALCGGVSITSPVNSGFVYNEGGMYSRDGSTRPFDASASGTSFSDGCGVVVLKRLEDAIRDRDNIYALIKGGAVNNDGAEKASFSAPSVEGQASVIRMALADAGVEAAQISYVETHGTATPLGDPIEIEALRNAFAGDQYQENSRKIFQRGVCAIGSIKSNIGHLTAAAGVAGFIKTVLALKYENIPATIGFSTPNPSINFSDTPFYVARENISWPRLDQKTRFAGISSFGVGGTNAHLILSEPPLYKRADDKKGQNVFVFSAKTKSALNAYSKKLNEFLANDPTICLADAAYTLQIGRSHFRYRRSIAGRTREDFIMALSAQIDEGHRGEGFYDHKPSVIFDFARFENVNLCKARELYLTQTEFRVHFQSCCELAHSFLSKNLRDLLFMETARDEVSARVSEKDVNDRLLQFAIGYSLTKLWNYWGVLPDAVTAHGGGIFIAACVSGVLTMENSFKVFDNIYKLEARIAEGSTLLVKCAESELVPQLIPGCSISATLDSNSCVVDCSRVALKQLIELLQSLNIYSELIQTDYLTNSILRRGSYLHFPEIFDGVMFNIPRTPVINHFTAEWLKDEEAISPVFIIAAGTQKIDFGKSIAFALSEANRVMLRIDPDPAVTFAVNTHDNLLPYSFDERLTYGSTEHSIGNIELAEALGILWSRGVNVDWQAYNRDLVRQRISMPTYSFENSQHWVQLPTPEGFGASILNQNLSSHGTAEERSILTVDGLIVEIRGVLEDASGLDLAGTENNLTFLEIGLDSLHLTQIATNVSRQFGVKITFRQLNEEYCSIAKLAEFLFPIWCHTKNGSIVSQLRESVHLPSRTSPSSIEDSPDLKKAFGAQARISKENNDNLTPLQLTWLKDFTKRYTAKTKKSKAMTQASRLTMADPRVVTGFKPKTKELVYQVIVGRSEGCRVWDIDGNEYIDILSGFGSSMFGFMPDFLKSACHKQLDAGVEIGPMHPLASEVSKLVCEMTGFDRAALCNTGSEAVLGALRMARTVTGRTLIISFSGSYHGINDEVIVRGSKSKRSYPGAPGILPEAVQNNLVLEYGTHASLDEIKRRCHEAAAVLVEPVQSRRMEFRPVDFLRELRQITLAAGTALIFDEVITGFRMHPNGCQGLFDIRADIATYGKVIGGGMPIGAIAGKHEWMDVLDGGFWQFGDDSVPPAGVTYFAGTFVRHPLALAAMKTVLDHLKAQGPGLQERLNYSTERMVSRVNSLFERYQLPYTWVHFGSAFKTKYDESVDDIDLFFYLMRYYGVHVLDFPHFLTTAHSESDIDFIVQAVENTCKDLRSSGLMPEQIFKLPICDFGFDSRFAKPKGRGFNSRNPPVLGARIGRDVSGEPNWFIPDSRRPGKYLMITGK